MERLEEVLQHNEMICKGCKGKGCCQHFPCFYIADDFKVLREKKYTHEMKVRFLVEYIKIGNVAIDMMCYGDRVYGPLNCLSKKPDIDKISNRDGVLFLRARAKGRPVVDFQLFLDEGGYYPCINWSLEKGCSLMKDERPYTGRMLIPRIGGRCIDTSNYEAFFESWYKNRLVMYDVYMAVKDMSI